MGDDCSEGICVRGDGPGRAEYECDMAEVAGDESENAKSACSVSVSRAWTSKMCSGNPSGGDVNKSDGSD
jgi:hypothetical protein